MLFVLNLEKDLIKVAEDDKLDRKLQDAGLTVKKRAPKKKAKWDCKKGKSWIFTL